MNRGFWQWLVAAQFVRLPSMMAPLAFAVLATQVTGSYRLGGLMMAVFVASEVVAAGPVGRLLDRVGVARGLRVLLVLCAAALCGLLITIPVVMVVFTALAGVLGGGMSGAIRALLANTVGDNMERAVSIDAMVIEVVVVAGPLLVAVLGPVGGILGMAGSYLIGALLVPQATATKKHGPRPPLGSIAKWLACAFAFGHLLSTIEVASLPLGQRLGGGPATAVIVVAVLTAASITGAAVYGWRRPELPPALFLAGMAIGAVLVGLGENWPVLIAGLVTVGICTGPLNATMSLQLQRTLPEERRAEGFGLVFTAQASGFALGSLSVSALPLAFAPVIAAGLALLVSALVPVAKPVTVE